MTSITSLNLTILITKAKMENIVSNSEPHVCRFEQKEPQCIKFPSRIMTTKEIMVFYLLIQNQQMEN